MPNALHFKSLQIQEIEHEKPKTPLSISNYWWALGSDEEAGRGVDQLEGQNPSEVVPDLSEETFKSLSKPYSRHTTAEHPNSPQ